MSATKPSGYPFVFNLILIVLVPICFVAGMLALTMALPIGELPYRLLAAGLIALFPLILAFRASADLARRKLRGLVRAPVAILLILFGYAAILGGLAQWRGFRPPHLIAAADHLHRVYLLGETPPALEVIEPKLPLHVIYDRPLPNPAPDERLPNEGKPGLDAIEIWSTEGDFRARFLGLSARVARLQFLDEHRLLAIRATGRAVLIDAEKKEVLRTIDPPQPLTEISVETSTRAALIAGKSGSGELVIHYFDLESGALVKSLRSPTYVTFAVTSDLRRLLIVEKGKKGEMLLVMHHLPTGDVEANIPRAALANSKGRKLKSVTNVAPVGDGSEHAIVFDGNDVWVWDVKKKKAAPFPLPKTKIYPYAIAPGGRTYFHRRTDAGDANPTGIYSLPGGELRLELPTRGQPPRIFFADTSIAVGPAIFSLEGKLIAGQMPESFSFDREHFVVPARDGSAFVVPDGKERLAVKNARLASVGALPLRGETQSAISAGGKLYAVRVKYPIEKVLTVLEELDRWQPPSG